MNTGLLPAAPKLPKPPGRTTPGFAFSTVERALKECLATRQFGNAETVAIIQFFGKMPPECVYCGSQNVQRWDHLVPVSKGGDTVLGNMVLACANCDDSKRDLSFEEWMGSTSKWSPLGRRLTDTNQRLESIRAYVQHCGYAPGRMEDTLDQQELAQLTAIRTELKAARENMEALIATHRARTGKF